MIDKEQDEQRSIAWSWFKRHEVRLNRAVEASHTREAWSPFIESPSKRRHPDGAHQRGRERFESRLHRPFIFSTPMPEEIGEEYIGDERSPYTGELLGITYPQLKINPLFEAVDQAWHGWRRLEIEQRMGVCLEILDRWAMASFENTYATMHTTGQAFMLAFAGSGASALDRGLEALAAAWVAMSQIPKEAYFSRSFGDKEPAHLYKRYRLMPVGVSVVFSCGSYPSWNAYPAILANLVTGNPVILKPHPDTILPMAIMVELAREVIQEAGFDPQLLTLACDTWDEPIGVALMNHPQTAIVDFTGGQEFGAWIEREYPTLQVYTETAGCNSVLLESTHDLNTTIDAIAYALLLFSAQMCTAPQNIWIPQGGVKVNQGVDSPYTQQIPVDQVIQRLVDRVNWYVKDPLRAGAICGALHSKRTLKELDVLTHQVEHLVGGEVLRASEPYVHLDFPEARTATPCLFKINPHSPQERALAQSERFGPISFIMIAKDREEALREATSDAHSFGAIASYVYTTDQDWIEHLEEIYALSGASVGVNLHRQRPINFTAAFSDYHVTGLNPAGTACLTDPAFVSRRFRVVQSKREV